MGSEAGEKEADHHVSCRESRCGCERQPARPVRAALGRDSPRTHDADLLLVHAWSPPAIALAGFEFPSEYQWRVWEGAAWQRLWDALEAAFGGLHPVSGPSQ